ncbi:MAG: ATP-grasp domain-containing protein [Bacteroidales bacterium]|nr:ATP-grasp domain-containing protein [Bacteroidales bacterium]
MKKKYCIAVTGLNAIDSPGPGISVIRGIRDSKDFDCRIIGFAYESLEPGIYMHDIIDKTYQIPYPSSGTDALMERLNYIHATEGLDVIIPNFDAELYSFIKLEPKLKEMGIKVFLPTLEQFEERHKVNLPKFGQKYNIRVPFSREIFSSNEIYGLSKDFTYPLVVKGKYYDAYIAYSAEQAINYFGKISSKWGLPIVIQEFIKGTEYNVIGLGDGKGNTIAAVPMRKQYITDKGKAWGGITIEDKDLLKITDSFLSQTKWRGGFELEMMKSPKNEYFLLEINPRIPAWVYLAVGAGQNIPEAVVKLALGEEVEPFKTYQTGKMFVRYSWDMIVDLDDFQKISTFGEL